MATLMARSVTFAACLAALAAPATAGMIFTAALDGSQEVPPSASAAIGTGVLALNDAQTRLTMTVLLVGLDLDGNQTPGDPDDDVTGMHIHRGPAGVNGPVVFGLITPNSDLNGDLSINAPVGVVSSGWDLNEGLGTTLGPELPNLLSEGLYFNVHTAQFPAGAIRGQIVPEPAALALLAVGAMALIRRRKRP